jgi:hypothetical protein
MHLSHQPIVVVDDYDQLDGRFRNVSELDNNTDAMALSLGRAQYDQDDLSLKVWRISNNRWSRQSEELPIHRNLDLSILFVGALLNDGTDPPLTSLREKIARYEILGEIREFYEKERHTLQPRLEELRELIDRLLPREELN